MTTSSSTALPGAAPGSERWILLLKNRGYNLQQAIANIRQAPVAARAALVANLRALAQTDQAGIAQAVQAAGGVVARHYWHLNAISIEVPAAAVPALRQLARVHSAWPVQAHSAADADIGSPAVPASVVLEAPMPVVPPQVDAVDAANHNVVVAWSLLGGTGAPYRGAGARLAVFDSGIDYNITGGSSGPGPHPAFDNGAGQTRVVAHLVVNETLHVNCNRLTTVPPSFPSPAVRPRTIL